MNITVHELVQGSPEWHLHRRTHLNASEAAAMQGVSAYVSRSDFVRERALGIEREVDAATQKRFDDGHCHEATARPWAEEIIGEELYPIVASREVEGLPLSASYDGATMGWETIFEHKTLNDELAAALERGEILAAYWPQMEQQLLVLGAERCLFMASNGSRESMRYAWYTSQPAERAKLVPGWKQFLADVENYRHVEAAPKATATLRASLPAVVIDVKGDVSLVSNLDRLDEALQVYVKAIPERPETDEDFANCEQAVKDLKTAEERLQAAEAAALARFESVDAMRTVVSNMIALARATRLRTDRLVKDRKEAIRDEIRQEGVRALAAHIERLNARLGDAFMPAIAANFAEVMKGKKTVASLRDAVSTELARAKIDASEIADRIEGNLKFLATKGDCRSLFADLPSICAKAAEDFRAQVLLRLADHEKKQEAQRERIRQEEAEKLRREQEERTRAATPADPPRVVPITRSSGAIRENPARAKAARPSDEDIITALAIQFDASESTVIAWLAEVDLEAASRRLAEPA